ncbi:MAG: hypothetical protein V4504_00615 [Patescibacteria group bacterium]
MIDAFLAIIYPVLNVVLPFGGTVLLGALALKLWRHYTKTRFISGIDWVLLEIKPPRDVSRSPRAMELFFTNALYQITNKIPKAVNRKGHTRFWFSLEIVSIEGQVHFYIRVPSRMKKLVETQMYAQYPQSEVIEVQDYALAVDDITKRGDWNIWGCEFKLEKPDPFPIKTYVDFGLDKDPKEEFKIDPLSPLIELFGSMESGEQMWVQIVIQASNKKYHSHSGGTHDFIKEAENTISELSKDFTSVKEDGSKEIRKAPWLDPVVEAILNKTTKLTFDTGIRAAYVAKKESFKTDNLRNLRLIFRQYAAPHLNSFSRVNSLGIAKWYDKNDRAVDIVKNRFLLEYQERNFFNHSLRSHFDSFWPISMFIPKYVHPQTFVLNTEELATIFHFPGQVIKVPGLERVESKEAAPPTNLPI